MMFPQDVFDTEIEVKITLSADYYCGHCTGRRSSLIMIVKTLLQSIFNSSNTDGLLIMADSNPVSIPVSILYKSIAGRYRPVRVADGPITARYRFIKNAS